MRCPTTSRGAASSSSAARPTWVDGNTWTQRVLLPAPNARVAASIAYDDARARVVLFGGGDADRLYSDTWEYGPAALPDVLAFGFGCAGTAGPPVLGSGVPSLGNAAFMLDLISTRPHAAVLFGLSGALQSLSLGGGCTLYLREPILPWLATANAFGFASIRMPVPSDQALRGIKLYAQGFVADPQGPVHGLALSGGLRLRRGD